MKLWKRQKQFMHKMVQWNKDLDLSEFYNEAGRRGFVNNASQKVMIDCFQNERLVVAELSRNETEGFRLFLNELECEILVVQER